MGISDALRCCLIYLVDSIEQLFKAKASRWRFCFFAANGMNISSDEVHISLETHFPQLATGSGADKQTGSDIDTKLKSGVDQDYDAQIMMIDAQRS